MGTTYENSCVMTFKDSSSNLYKMYPVTKKSNVVGFDDAIRNQAVTSAGSGAVYTATVAGITSLSAGVSFVMIPHTVSTTSSPKLNVNSLGEKSIRRRVSNCTGTFYNASAPNDWLTAGKPITVTYDGECWIADLPVPNANDIMGAVSIANGGTGATTAAQARINLGIETTDGTVSSGNVDYAEVGEWVDGNTSNENRIGYFVCVDNATAGTTMRKATASDDIRGVTVTAPAFAGGCSSDKFDSSGALLAKYDYVAVMGIVSVIDDGTCVVNGRCMPNSSGIATKVAGNYGYQVIERVDGTHILVAVEPGTDFQYRVKNYVDSKRVVYTAIIQPSSWTLVTKTYTSTDATGQTVSETYSHYVSEVSVPGILSTDTPHITPRYAQANGEELSFKTQESYSEAWSMINHAYTYDGVIKFVSFSDAPTAAIWVMIEVMR